MKATDLRKRDGSYTPVARKIDKETQKFIHRMFRKYGKKLHPDSLYVLFSHAILCEATWQVIRQASKVLEKKDKKQRRIQKRKERIISKTIKTKPGRKRLAEAMLKGIKTKKGKRHGRG